MLSHHKTDLFFQQWCLTVLKGTDKGCHPANGNRSKKGFYRFLWKACYVCIEVQLNGQFNWTKRFQSAKWFIISRFFFFGTIQRNLLPDLSLWRHRVILFKKRVIPHLRWQNRHLHLSPEILLLAHFLSKTTCRDGSQFKCISMWVRWPRMIWCSSACGKTG